MGRGILNRQAALAATPALEADAPTRGLRAVARAAVVRRRALVAVWASWGLLLSMAAIAGILVARLG